MIVQKQLKYFKQELHNEIDRIFDLDENDPDLIISIQDFSKKSERFYKKYFTLCRTTNDILFENDFSIPLIHKERYRNQNISGQRDKYDNKIMPIIETLNMLSAPGFRDFTDFSNMLADAIKFLFMCYCFTYSTYLPKWVKHVDDIKEIHPVSIQLKKLLNSFAEDLILCFRTGNIPSEVKIPLTLLFSSELQDQVCLRIAEYMSAEDIAIGIALKMIGKHGGKLDDTAILDSMQETEKVASDPNSERVQLAFQRLIKIMTDLFMSNLSTHLKTSPLRPKVLTTQTKMKLLDAKNDLLTELDREFESIK